MSNLRQLPDLSKLKAWKSMDLESYKEITASLEKGQRVLILAPKDSGKNTVMNAVVNHLHRLQKDPFVIPAMEGIPTKGFKAHHKVKQLKKLISGFDSYVAAVQYTGSGKTDINKMVEYFLPHFDLIIDLRNMNGRRVVCNLVKGRHKANYIYTNPQFIKYIAA